MPLVDEAERVGWRKSIAESGAWKPCSGEGCPCDGRGFIVDPSLCLVCGGGDDYGTWFCSVGDYCCGC